MQLLDITLFLFDNNEKTEELRWGKTATCGRFAPPLGQNAYSLKKNIFGKFTTCILTLCYNFLCE